MFLGSGIEIMLHAMEKAKTEGMVSTPPFIDPLDMKVRLLGSILGVA